MHGVRQTGRRRQWILASVSRRPPFRPLLSDVREMFQRAPDRFASGENPKTLLEELLDEMKWKDTGRW